jgi:hypothetical protein
VTLLEENEDNLRKIFTDIRDAVVEYLAS